MSPKLPRITATQLLRALRRAGWEVTQQEGSHMQLRHPTKRGRVTVAFHPGATIKPYILKSVLEQASLTVDELRELL